MCVCVCFACVGQQGRRPAERGVAGYAKRVILIYDHDVQHSQIINTLAIKYTPGCTPAHPMPKHLDTQTSIFEGAGIYNWSTGMGQEDLFGFKKVKEKVMPIYKLVF